MMNSLEWGSVLRVIAFLHSCWSSGKVRAIRNILIMRSEALRKATLAYVCTRLDDGERCHGELL